MHVMTKPVILPPDGVEIDPASGRYALPGGERGRLTENERVMFLVLLAHRSTPVSREALFSAVHDGLTPDERSLRAVDQAVSRLRRRLFPSGRGIVAVRGKGYRLDLPPEPTPLGHASAPADDELIGRGTELALIEAELALSRQPTRHLELVGAGGIGKSSLARAVLRRAGERGEQAAWVDLDGVADTIHLATRLREALGLGADPGRDTADVLVSIDAHLSAHPRSLLVLDDCDGAERLLPELCRTLSALRTTRVVLTARSSHAAAWSACGKSLTTIAIGPLSADAALRLLTVRGSNERGAAPSPSEQAGLAEVARALGGWPLALELAVARWRAASPEEAPEVLSRIAKGGALGLEGLAEVMVAMWQALEPPERQLLCRVALGRGAIPARWLGPGSGPDGADGATTRSLAVLQRGGWLGPRRVEGRVELHALVREFVLARVTEDDERALARHLARHAAHVTRGPITMDPRATSELAQLAPALEIALEVARRGDAEPATVAALLLALGRHHHLSGPRDQALATAAAMGEHIGRGDPTARRQLHGMRSLILLGARAGDGGRADAHAMLAFSRTPEDRAEALSLIARTHRELPDVAIGALREAITLPDSPLERARAESVLAAVLAREERFDEALAPMTRAVDTFEEHAVETRYAEENYLAFVLVECGVSRRAQAMYERAEAGYLAHTKKSVRPGFRAVRSLLAIDRADFAGAIDELERVITLGGEMGRPVLAAQACVWRVACDVLLGRLDEARRRAADPFAGYETSASGLGYDALEPVDRAFLHGLRALLSTDPEARKGELARARSLLGGRFPSTSFLVDLVGGQVSPQALAPVGLRARLARHLVAKVPSPI